MNDSLTGEQHYFLFQIKQSINENCDRISWYAILYNDMFSLFKLKCLICQELITNDWIESQTLFLAPPNNLIYEHGIKHIEELGSFY